MGRGDEDYGKTRYGKERGRDEREERQRRSGVLELCDSNGFVGETDCHGQRWSMSCESNIVASTGFFKGRQFMGPESTSPSIEVYIAGSFSGTPIILTKTLQLGLWKKHARKGLLDSKPEKQSSSQVCFSGTGKKKPDGRRNIKRKLGKLKKKSANVSLFTAKIINWRDVGI